MTDRTDPPHHRPHDRDDASGPVSAAAGGAAGSAAGAAAGAVAGTLTLGPIGTIVGALVGALGGGWAGLAAAELPGPGAEDEAYFREHHASTRAHLADASYDRVAPAYHLGHVAARNPDYRGRSFDDVEPDLRRGWGDDVSARHGAWTGAREYARAAYDRAARNAGAQPSAIADATPIGTTASHDRASANDRLAADAPVAGNPNASAPPAGSPGDPGAAPGSVRDGRTGDEVR